MLYQCYLQEGGYVTVSDRGFGGNFVRHELSNGVLSPDEAILITTAKQPHKKRTTTHREGGSFG
jgi:hypothetical protein